MTNINNFPTNIKRGPDSLLAGLLFAGIVVLVCLCAGFCSIVYALFVRHKKPGSAHVPKPLTDPEALAKAEAEERRLAEVMLSVPGKGGAKAMLKAAAAARDSAAMARRAAEAEAAAAAEVAAAAAAIAAEREAKAKAKAKKARGGNGGDKAGGKSGSKGGSKRGDDSAEEAPPRRSAMKGSRRIPETELDLEAAGGRGQSRRRVLRPPPQPLPAASAASSEPDSADYGDDDRAWSEGSELPERAVYAPNAPPRGRPRGPPRRDDSYGSYR